MLRRLRQRIQTEESGFTLIELLVVVLIIGILAAIAIPAFLGQREKAQDSESKSATRNAVSAAEAYFTDGQTYVGMTAAKLVAIEPSLSDATALTVTVTDADTMSVRTQSATARTFTIKRDAGSTTRTCTPGGGGCKDAASVTKGW